VCGLVDFPPVFQTNKEQFPYLNNNKKNKFKVSNILKITNGMNITKIVVSSYKLHEKTSIPTSHSSPFLIGPLTIVVGDVHHQTVGRDLGVGGV